jgi:hypothetical protein
VASYRNFFLMACLSLADAFGSFQTQEPSQAPRTPEPSAKLRGKIHDQSTGAALAGVTVRLLYESEPAMGSPDPNPADATTTTGANGEYSFTGLKQGKCLVYAETTGYVRRYYGARMAGPSPGIAITIPPEGQVSNVDIALLRQGVLQGRIAFEDGAFVSEALVSAMMTGFKGEQPFYFSLQTAESDADGNYTLQGLPAGQYLIRVTEQAPRQVSESNRKAVPRPRKEVLVPTYYPGVEFAAGAAKLVINPGQRLDGIDIRVKRSKPYDVCGSVDWRSVSKGDETLLALVTTEMDARSVLRPYVAKVAQDNTFCFQAVLPGSYFLEPARGPADIRRVNRFSGQTRVEVVDEDVSKVEFVASPPVSFRGSVRIERPSSEAPDKPRPREPIVSSGARAARSPIQPPPPPVAASQVQAVPSIEVQPGQDRVQAATAVTSINNPTQGIESLPAFEKGVRVRLSAPARLMVEEPKAVSGDDGSFLLENVPTGRYFVDVSEVPSGFYVKRVELSGGDIRASGLDAVSGPGGVITIVLSEGARRIDGLVVDEKGNPVYGAKISVWDENSRLDGQGASIHWALADASGHFSVSGLAPGRYRAAAWPEDINPTVAQNPRFCRTFAGEAIRVGLLEAAQEPNPLRLTVIPTESIRAAGW